MTERFEHPTGLWKPGNDTFETTVSGYVRGATEMKTSRNGKLYARFTVRVKDGRADESGIADPATSAYYTIMAFGRTGEQAEWLEDGERVLVTGGLERREKNNKPGEYWMTIMARAIGRDLNQPQARAERQAQSYNQQEFDGDEPF